MRQVNRFPNADKCSRFSTIELIFLRRTMVRHHRLQNTANDPRKRLRNVFFLRLAICIVLHISNAVSKSKVIKRMLHFD